MALQMNQDKISLKNVCFRYAGTEEHVLKEINLSIKHGEFLVLTGNSGCGKSSLLLFFLIVCTTLSFTAGGMTAGLLLYGVVFLKTILARQWRLAGICTIIYTLLYCAASYLHLPMMLTSMIQFFFLRGLTIALAFSSFFKATDIGELIIALEHIHLPPSVTISVAVMLRFVPSIRQDFMYIRQGMKTRGMKLGLVQVIKRPGQTYEALIVPILMRIIRTSSELAASAETRGILSGEPKSDYKEVRIRIWDCIGFLFFTLLFLGVLISPSYI